MYCYLITRLFSQSERSRLVICSIIANDVHSFYTNPFYKNVENGQNFNLRSSKNLHKTRRFILVRSTNIDLY